MALKLAKKFYRSLFLFFSLSCLLFASPALAQENNDSFDIKLKSSYQVNATGKTSVKQTFTISNQTPEFFITKYGIIVSSTNITNIQITDNGQKLDPQINELPGQTSIGITFEEKIVGEGKSRELVISYLDSDIAQISGKVLELNIPALADPHHYSDYQLDLMVPSIFGNASRIKPSAFTLKQGGDFDHYHFQNLQGQAISAIFGESQVFDLKLSYVLDNPNSQNALTQITLPPDTSKQKLHYHRLDPQPKNLKLDGDGNLIATYEVPANNSFQVEVLAQVLLTLNPNLSVPPAEVLSQHLQAQRYWELENPNLQAAAAQLNSASDINNFVVDTLNYTQFDLNSEFRRFGAAEAIREENRDQATCQEYTDLFVALARLKKIPAKRILGYAYSSNEELKPISVVGDILHAWPAYYDSESQAWREIDPTWQDTTNGIDYFSKFDLNHITFAINGISSTLPYPAGSYTENEDQREKKIFVDFSQTDFPIINPDLSLEVSEQKLSKFPIPGKYLLKVKNNTGESWYFSKFELAAGELIIDHDTLPMQIAPFQELELAFSVYNKGALISQKNPLSVNIQLQEGQSFDYESLVSGLGQLKISDPKRIIFLGGGFVVIALATGSLLVLGRKLASTLRRQSQKSEEASQQLHTLSTTLSENQTIGDASQDTEVANPKK